MRNPAVTVYTYATLKHSIRRNEQRGANAFTYALLHRNLAPKTGTLPVEEAAAFSISVVFAWRGSSTP